MTIDSRQQLLATINGAITLNGTGAITGPILNNILDTMVNSSLFSTGQWSQYTSYYPLDIVQYSGNSYISNSTNVNKIPTNTDYWLPFSNTSAGVGGPANSVQYNSGSGTFAGSANLTFDGTVLTATKIISPLMYGGTTTASTLTLQSSTSGSASTDAINLLIGDGSKGVVIQNNTSVNSYVGPFVSIGQTSTNSTNASLVIGTNVFAGPSTTLGYGIKLSTGFIVSGTTPSAVNYSSVANPFTSQSLGGLTHFSANGPSSVPTGSSVTSVTGFSVDSSIKTKTASTVSSAYGYTANLADSSGTSWNLYFSGNAPSYFQGSVAIGTTTYSGIALNVVGGAATDTLAANTASVTTSATVNALTLTSSTTPALILPNATETTTVSATAAASTINFDVITQSILYYTASSTGNWTLNVRGNVTSSLDSFMTTGQTITIVFLATNGSTAYYESAFTIDGTSVTPKWQGGTAPTSGNASALDVYTYSILKTGSATYTVLASITKFQ